MARTPRVTYRALISKRRAFTTDKESLRGRYRPLTAAQQRALVCWAHR